MAIKSFGGLSRTILFATVAAGLAACGPDLPPAPGAVAGIPATPPDYIIGPRDNLSINVWRAPELSVAVPVRPDGRISTPLIEDLTAAGKTPSQLAREIETRLSTFIQEPVVTVIVNGFVGPFSQQVRVVGEATTPTAVPFVANMSVLDLMIAVGGLTEFAAGNSAVLVRRTDEGQQEYNVRLDDLLLDGDISANVPVLPGDVLIVPQSWF